MSQEGEGFLTVGPYDLERKREAALRGSESPTVSRRHISGLCRRTAFSFMSSTLDRRHNQPYIEIMVITTNVPIVCCTSCVRSLGYRIGSRYSETKLAWYPVSPACSRNQFSKRVRGHVQPKNSTVEPHTAAGRWNHATHRRFHTSSPPNRTKTTNAR